MSKQAPHRPATAEHARLAEATGRAEDDLFGANPWYEWGPYLSERAWGTVREDYSDNGDAWSYFPHDQARSRAYRWNEDGMAGLSDIHHDLCLALALWNGTDPILKERMFGLTGPQGNHGEDAKEYWWYLEGLPSHALLQWRYHYPQAEFPYQRLIDENARRGRDDFEFELLDTGVFDDGRFWIVDVTYAKADPTDILAHITVHNHGPEAADIDVLPTMWLRNTWRPSGSADIPRLFLDQDAVTVDHPRLGGYRLEAAPASDGTRAEPLFCNNETNTARVFGAAPITPFPKDGINDHVVSGADTVNPAREGTKAAWRYHLTVAAGDTVELRLRLRPAATAEFTAPPTEWSTSWFDEVLVRRRAEADEFYRALAPSGVDSERMRILRQSCAGLIWSKQMYPYRMTNWLDGDPAEPAPPVGRHKGRNTGWRHLDSFDVLAMPDPWEYPWFAAWDLAFHTIPWAHLDPAFAKYQLLVLLKEWFLHPNGALPAYEWSFDDVNPPVHALAAVRVFLIDGGGDIEFLERVFQKLLLNFTWWLNRQDPDGNNLIGGGFLGLDNISPVDRSHLPPGVRLEQADGTGWLAYYSAAMLLLTLVLADRNAVYEDMVVKFLEQFVLIMDALDESGLYDPDDGFFYDRLLDATGNATPIRVQTLVGVIPALVAVSIPERNPERLRRLGKRFARMMGRRGNRSDQSWRVRSADTPRRLLLSVLTENQLRTVLSTLFDENAFLSPHGLRSLSKRFGSPYTVTRMPGAVIDYAPAESRTAMYGGNSNWRGPVWFPVNYLVIRALLQYAQFFGDDFTIDYPTGSGRQCTLREVADDLADRLVGIWLPNAEGNRPVNGGAELLQTDPAWKDNLLFYEYFHGDNGAGLGASHQTGWTALVADLILDPPSCSAGTLGYQAHPSASDMPSSDRPHSE
ncbi:glucosidase [Rhodococcus aetherivorans]|uniref:MGH1-like glycoside hydrolase domain-containing protein n=1 Tax=Rhodococcus aetherivorans TaxID=191292 RepID=UPI0036701ABC